MPKVIDVTQTQILQITKKWIEEKKFEEINCRNIAKEAGIGVGTLYHYFSSKGEIMALILLDDWKSSLETIQTEVSLKDGLRSIYDAIYSFSSHYHDLWDYERMTSTKYMDILTNHSKVTRPIALELVKVLQYNHLTVQEDVIDFVAENMVRYASRLWDYSKLEEIFIQILGGKTNG